MVSITKLKDHQQIQSSNRKTFKCVHKWNVPTSVSSNVFINIKFNVTIVETCEKLQSVLTNGNQILLILLIKMVLCGDYDKWSQKNKSNSSPPSLKYQY